ARRSAGAGRGDEHAQLVAGVRRGGGVGGKGRAGDRGAFRADRRAAFPLVGEGGRFARPRADRGGQRLAFDRLTGDRREGRVGGRRRRRGRRGRWRRSGIFGGGCGGGRGRRR